MKSTRTLKATGLVLIAVVLGLLTVQGSYALWNKAISSNPGTIQAADFRISLTDTSTSNVINMTTPQGTAATLQLSATSLGVVYPNQSTYAGVQVGNVTNASGEFTIQAVTGTPIITNNNAAAPLSPHLSIKVATAATLQDCSQAALYTPPGVLGTATKDIAKGLNGVFCFQVTMAANMPASVNGQAASISIPITVNQL